MNGMPALDPCVHCGFCLQACPTFVATGDEADSPRGRIVLMQAVHRGTLAEDDPAVRYHLDRCLGCRACETACPSGVEYGHGLEEIRARLLQRHPTGAASRLVLWIMAEPAVRRVVFTLARMLRPVAGFFAGRSRIFFGLASLAATRRLLRVPPPAGDARPSRAEPAGEAVVFRGCIMDGLFRHVNDATHRTLDVNGYTLASVPRQGCCGALHAHAGRRHEAMALARINVEAFRAAPVAAIAINSAGCGAMLKDYGHLLADDPLAGEARAFSGRVRDVTELLADRGPLQGAAMPRRVAYDAPCHLHHAQRVTDSPLQVLRAIPGLEIVHHIESDACCGSAGLYSLEQRDLSMVVLDRKIANLVAAAPEIIATGNPGCTMHIGAGLKTAGCDVPVVHPVELLDASYRRAGHR